MSVAYVRDVNYTAALLTRGDKTRKLRKWPSDIRNNCHGAFLLVVPIIFTYFSLIIFSNF